MNAGAVAEQGVLALVVVLREVFPAAWTPKEVVAHSKAMQEVQMCVPTVPLQEVLARLLVVQEVFARHRLVGCVPDGRCHT